MSVDLTHLNLPKAGGLVFPPGHKKHAEIFHTFPGGRLRDYANHDHRLQDEELLKRGILDPMSMLSGYMEQHDPIRVLVHGADGVLKSLRYSHNIRTNTGGVFLVEAFLGGLNLGVAGTITASSATSITSGVIGSVTANQYAGHIIAFNASATGLQFAKIVSHTSGTTPVFTLDQSYTVGSATGAASGTPSTTGGYVVLPGRGFAPWVAFTTTASWVPNTTDVQGTGWANEVTTGGLGRQFGTYSLTTNPTGSSTSINQTAAAKLHLAITATATVTGMTGAGLFEDAVAGNGNPLNEGTFTSVTMASGDQLTFDWTQTLN